MRGNNMRFSLALRKYFLKNRNRRNWVLSSLLLYLFTSPLTLFAMEPIGTDVNNPTQISFTGAPTSGEDGTKPDVAYNSTDGEYLVVWAGVQSSTTEGQEIYGQRYNSTTGVPIGSEIRISHSTFTTSDDFEAFTPSIAYNSTDNQYLVVWDANNDNIATGLAEFEYEVYGQRLNGDGTEIGGDFRISDMGTDGDDDFVGENAQVVYNLATNQYLVVWEGDDDTVPLVNGETEIFGQLISNIGDEVGTNDFRISSQGRTDDASSYDADLPAVAYNSTDNEYFVVWQGDDEFDIHVDDEREVYGQLLDANGAEIGSDFLVTNFGENGDDNLNVSRAKVAYNSIDNQYLVVFGGDETQNGEDEIHGQLVAADGSPLGDDFDISTTGLPGNRDVDASLPNVIHVRNDAAAAPLNNYYYVTWKADFFVNGKDDRRGRIVTNTGDASSVGTDFTVGVVSSPTDTIFDASRGASVFNPDTLEILNVWEVDIRPGNEDIVGVRSGATVIPPAESLPEPRNLPRTTEDITSGSFGIFSLLLLLTVGLGNLFFQRSARRK